MPFKIYNDNKLVSTERTFKDLEAYLTKQNIKGLKERTLKNKLKDNNDELTKGTYRIKRVEHENKTEDKIIKTAEIEDYEGDIFIEYKSDLIITNYNKYEFARQVMNEIKKRDIEEIRNLHFKVAFLLDNGKVISTVFLNFNLLYESILSKLTKWMDEYGEDEGVVFKSVMITSIKAPRDEEVLIYGTNNKRIDSYVISLSNLIEGMILDNESNKKLIQISDDNYIYRPKTIKNCFIKSCYMAKLKKYDVVKITEKFLERHPIPSFELEEIANYISLMLKIKINVYILTNGLNKYTYNQGTNKEEINILIIGNHSHALINKKDITDFNREEFNLLMNVKEEEEIQKLIKLKKSKNGGELQDDEGALQQEEALLKGIKKSLKKARKEIEIEEAIERGEPQEENEEEGKEDDEIEEEEKKGKYEDFKIATYDFETCDASADEKKKQSTLPYAVGYYDGVEYSEIYKQKKEDDIVNLFLEFIEHKTHRDIIFYGHNAGKFDLYILIRAIIKRHGWTITAFLEQAGRIINLVVEAQYYTKGNKPTYIKRTLVFRDSFNFISCSLDKACKDFKPKTKKLEGDVNHALININNCHTKEIYDYTKAYLKNDCLALYEILNIYNDILIKKFKINIRNVLTNASIARQYYLKKFYKQHELPIYTLPKSIDTELRKFYFGGRNECMTKIGYQTGKFYYLDFTSLYPFMMRENQFPYDKVRTETINNNVFKNEWFGFLKCKFRHTKKDNIPLHAVLKNHKLMFPYCDNWQESILTTEEIRYSIDNDIGYEYHFYEGYLYDKKDYLFRDCVDDVYKLKLKAEQDGNKSLRSMAKIIINSLYGFWGINFYNREQTKLMLFKDDKALKEQKEAIARGDIEPEELEQDPKNKPKSAEDKRKFKIQSLLFRQKLKNYNRVGKYDVFDIVDKIKTQCANVGLAFFTTSYARVHLYKLLKDVKDRGGKTYYMDTDSIITDYNIYDDAEMVKKWVGSGGEGIGELKNETGTATGYYKELITLGNKFYALRNRDLGKDEQIILKMKGVNGKANYKNKNIDFVNKNINLDVLDKYEGKEKTTFEDFFLLSLGFNLNVSNMSFISGVNNMIIKNDDLIKLNNDKTVKKLYDKGIVDSYDNITPLIL